MVLLNRTIKEEISANEDEMKTKKTWEKSPPLTDNGINVVVKKAMK